MAGVERGREVRGGTWLLSRRAVVGAAAGSAAAGAAAGRLGGFFRLDEALAAPSKAMDARILRLVLQLECTQVAFYEQALRQAGLKGELRDFAQTVLGHERAHLAAIKAALGAKAGPKPTFEFGPRTRSVDAFRRTAVALEDVAVGGYNGQAPNLTKGTLAAAAEIVSVEARHASWVRAIAGEVAAPAPVDAPLSGKQVAAALHRIGLRA